MGICSRCPSQFDAKQLQLRRLAGGQPYEADAKSDICSKADVFAYVLPKHTLFELCYRLYRSLIEFQTLFQWAAHALPPQRPNLSKRHKANKELLRKGLDVQVERLDDNSARGRQGTRLSRLAIKNNIVINEITHRSSNNNESLRSSNT